MAITTPAGYTVTTANVGCKDGTQPPYTADRDSKCNCQGASPCLICVTLTTVNSTNLNVDCGYVCNGQIGDFVWNDVNGNGCQDTGELGIPNVKVDLYSGTCGTTGTFIATTNTDSTGHYLFSGLCPGDYQVAITTPAGYAATTPNTGCKDSTQPPYTSDRDSKCNCAGVSPCTNCVTLTAANPVNLNVDCGYVSTLRLSCSGNTGTVGVPYTSMLTVNGGCSPYTFSIISGSLPGGLTLDSGSGIISGTPTAPGTSTYTAQVKDSCGNTATTTSQNCSIIIVCNGQIGDFVWYDANGNGCQDAGELGIPNVKVSLYSGACGTTGTLVATTTTDSTGHYLFSGLCPGNYQVAITTPAGYNATTPNKGCKDSTQPPYTSDRDSKCNCAGVSPCTNCVTITPANPVNLNVDCGYIIVPPLTLTCSGGSGIVGQLFTGSLSVSGGTPPYSFSFVGSPPAWLNLNAMTGALSGTPPTAGTFTFTAMVTDAKGKTAISTCSSGCASGCNNVYNFSIVHGVLGTSQPYTVNGVTITAYGFTNVNTPTALFGKNDGGDENGIGISGEADHEINTSTYIQVDLAQVIAAGSQSGTITIGSVQAGEGYDLYGSSALGTLGTLLVNNGISDNTPFAIPGFPTYRYLGVRAHVANVLLQGVTFSCAGTCAIVISPPPCTATISGYIRCFCDLCVCKDQDHDDRDHDGRDHSKCNHKYNECNQDGQNHSGCRHERGWCNRDGQNHSGCDHAHDVCKVDKRDHSWCRHQLNICIQDGHNHAECDHAHAICKEDGRDHSTCNHKYSECSLDGKDHSACRHARGWCNRDGHDHSGCNHAAGVCKVDTRDHSACSHDRDICVCDGHDHSLCDHAHSGCRFGTSAWQCGLQGFTVQLKNSAGTTVLATQLSATNGFYSFTGLTAGTYQVVVTPLANYSQTCDPDGALDNKTTVTVANCQVLTCADFCYKKVVTCYSSIAGFIYGVCGRCAHDDHGHDARDHDGCDHSKCNHKYNECARDGQDHSGCRHERGWCNRDGNNHSYCNHAAGYCRVDTRSHSLCNHALNICVQDGYNHAECDHSHGICKHNGGDHSKCNHKYNECALDGKDHTGCRHERGWCNRDGYDHSKCDHARGYCAVDTRDHSACNHDRNICLQDGHNHAGCNHAQTGCWYGFTSVECGLQGFTVQLKNSAGTTVLATQITAANGSYVFSNLSAGTYLVVVTPLSNYVQTSDPDCVVDGKTIVTVASCQSRTCVNFTYQQPCIAFRSAACGYAVSGVLKLAINKPAGTQPGDVMVASVAVRPSSVVITAPAGWTLVRDLDNTSTSGNSSSLAVYYKVAGTSEPASYNWTFNTSAGAAGGIQSFSGVDALNPIDVEAGQNKSAALLITAPSVTTRYANDMIVTSHEIASLVGFTPPSGMTEAFDAMSGTVRGAVGVSVEGNYRLQKTVGATGTATATASNDADTGNADTLALKSK